MALSAASRGRVNVLDPAMLAPFQSLLAQTYGKPVQLNLTPLPQPHLDADILASTIAQRLRDRKTNSTRVLRNAVRRAKVPDPLSPTTPSSRGIGEPFAFGIAPRKDATHEIAKRRTALSEVLKSLSLPKVTSLRVQASGRLSKRMTANRAASKTAIKGITTKGAGPIVHGVHKAHVQSALRHGKRRIGSYGVKARIGTSSGSSAHPGQEWSTGAYSYNKQNLKTAPVARANADKLLQNYATLSTRKAASRAILTAQRKNPERVYLSDIKVQDRGGKVVLNAFVYDGHEKEGPRVRVQRRSTAKGAAVATPGATQSA